MSKYKERLLRLLSTEEIKSTNEILKELENEVNKAINWHALYRILMDLKAENKIECLKTKAGFFWRRK